MADVSARRCPGVATAAAKGRLCCHVSGARGLSGVRLARLLRAIQNVRAAPTTALEILGACHPPRIGHLTALRSTGARQCLHAINTCVPCAPILPTQSSRREIRLVLRLQGQRQIAGRTTLSAPAVGLMPLQDRGRMQEGRSLGRMKIRNACAYARSCAPGHPSEGVIFVSGIIKFVTDHQSTPTWPQSHPNSQTSFPDNSS
jgi:hypothetical protein